MPQAKGKVASTPLPPSRCTEEELEDLEDYPHIREHLIQQGNAISDLSEEIGRLEGKAEALLVPGPPESDNQVMKEPGTLAGSEVSATIEHQTRSMRELIRQLGGITNRLDV